MTQLFGICGSLRATSNNRMLLNQAAQIFAPNSFEIGDIDLPLYNGDVEDAQGIPAAVQTLANQIAAADAVIISTPEYNKSISGALKNALDWVSRTKDNPWAGKPVAIMSAAAGRAGGERAQSALRLCMVPFRPRIIQGPEMLLAGCMDAFDDAGVLATDAYRKMLQGLMDALKDELARPA